MNRLTTHDLQRAVGVTEDGIFGPITRQATAQALVNMNAPAVTHADLVDAAQRLGVSVGHINAVRLVEAPRGAFDSFGRPAMLYERHVFSRNSEPRGRWNLSDPSLSGLTGYGPGGYGSFSAQHVKFLDACALDVEAAFCAVSWGAFQILGENARAIGYASPLEMAFALVESEAAHLDSFVRFVLSEGLADELAACKPGDAASCVPFVSRYNGPGYATFHYDIKMATALK